MRHLLLPISLRRIREHRLRSAMTVLGVALGVAVLVAVVATNGAILDSFRSTLGDIGGKIHLEVRGGDTGLPEELVEQVRGVPGVRCASVAIQRTLDVADDTDHEGRPAGEAVALLGINFTEDPAVLQVLYGVTKDQIGKSQPGPKAAKPADEFDNPLEMLDKQRQLVVSDVFAAKYKKAKGDTIDLMTKDGRQPFTLYDVTPAKGPQKAFGGSLAIIDWLDAQEVFGLQGRVDRIDVAISDPEGPGQLAAVAAAIKKQLGDRYEVEPPSARQARQQHLLRSFHMGLTIGAGIALLVGMFLIYHTLSISVAQRRSEIGILRATGATRSQVVQLFTMEGAVFGLVGSALGVVLGAGLADILMKQAAGPITDIYVRVHTGEVTVSPGLAALAVVLGVASSTIAALVPARQASRLSPVDTIRTPAFAQSGAVRLRPTLRDGIALGLLLVAPIVAQGPMIFGFPWLGMASMGLVMLAATLLCRTAVIASNMLFAPVAGRLFGLQGRLAADNVTRGADKGAVTVASLMVGLSMVVASSTMTGSFQHSIDQWVEQAVPADLFVTSNARLGGTKNQPISPELGVQMASVPGILGVDMVRLRNVDFRNTQILLLSVDVRIRFMMHRTTWEVSKWLGDKNTVIDRMQAGEGVIISDTLAHRFGLTPGAEVQLQTPQGRKGFKILGSIVDYSSDQGAVFLDRKLYIAHWHDDLVDTFEPYLRPGADLEGVRAEILRRYGKAYHLFVLTNAEFRQEIRRMIGKLFDVMRALELVTVIIALLSVVNTLLTAILDRMREIGVLRAIGMLRGQLVRMILIESLGLALVGAAIGVCVGLANGTILLDVVSKQDAGWDVPVLVSWPMICAYAASLVLVGLLAAIYPARFASRIAIVDALGYE